MIIRVTIAVVIGIIVAVALPSLIATWMLLTKGIGVVGEKRRRRALFHR